MTTNVIKKDWFNPITASVLVILVAISLALRVSQVVNDALFVVLLILSVLIAASIRVADQWEKAVVLRMGKFKGLKGPGPFMIIPIIDTVSNYIDQRVRVSAFKAEQTLTKDTVPVNVDAVVYWTVWDVEKAALEVQEYQKAIEHIAQTGLRDTIGKHELSALLQERDKIAEDLQQVLDRNTNPWGITCQTVGIKDIAIPQDLAEAMSKEAQAERERRARVILGTAETEIAEKFEGVAAIEKEHEERYRKLLKNLRDKKVFSKDGDAVWQCANCGHIVIGKSAPDVCPVCNHPQSYFQVRAENY